MNNTILRSLFFDNPGLSDAMNEFCRSFPEYAETQQEYRRLMEELERAMGSSWTLQFEEALNRCWAVEDNALYLFGLGVRREALRALAAEPGYSTPR